MDLTHKNPLEEKAWERTQPLCEARGLLPAINKESLNDRSFADSSRSICTYRLIDTPYRRKLSEATWSSPCSVSMLSAYSNDFGACFAIRERIEVKAELAEASGHESDAPTFLSNDKYLTSCVEQACITTRRRLPAYLSLQISSGMPAGKGIGTSSAVGAAVTSAFLRALNVKAGSTEIVKAASDAAREGGVTQVGSIDDIWASVRGGVVITKGSSRQLVANWPAPETVDVLILIPACTRPPIHSLNRRAIMAPHKRSFDLLLSRLFKSRDALGMYSAMSDAAFITARAFAYPTEPLAVALQNGALGVSLSGKGPAIGAITEPGATEKVIEGWREFPGRIIRTRTDNAGLRAVRSPGCFCLTDGLVA